MRGISIILAAWAMVLAVGAGGEAAAQSAAGSVNAANIVTASRHVQANRKSDGLDVNPNTRVTPTVSVSGSAGVAGAKASFTKTFDLKGLLGLFHKAPARPAQVPPPVARAVAKDRPAPPIQARTSASALASSVPSAAPVQATPVIARAPAVVSPKAEAPRILPAAGAAVALVLLTGAGFFLGKSGLVRSAAHRAFHHLRPPHIQVHGRMAAAHVAAPEFEKHSGPAVAFILRPGVAETHLTFLDSDAR